MSRELGLSLNYKMPVALPVMYLLRNDVSHNGDSLRVAFDKNLEKVCDLGISHFQMHLNNAFIFAEGFSKHKIFVVRKPNYF